MVFHCGYSGYTGGGSGEFFDDVESQPTTVTGISEIHFRYGQYIDSIQLTLATAGGPVQLPKHGGNGGANSRIIQLDAGEFIVAMYGRYGQFVDAITQINTNKRTFQDPIGGNGGASNFYYEAPDGTEIIGFMGRSGNYIDAIGVELRNRQ